MAIILDGKKVATTIESDLENKVRGLPTKLTLGILQIGNNPSSNTYIQQKINTAKRIGVTYQLKKLAADTQLSQIRSLIKDWNNNPDITGFIIQLPLPDHYPAQALLNQINPAKDVDALSANSLGRLLQHNSIVIPATARGILSLLDYYKISVAGKQVAMIGRSALVGKPVALSLLNRNATVTIAHSQSHNLIAITKAADIIITAIGQPHFIKPSHLKPEAVVIDVGITSSNRKLIGDVDFEATAPKVAAITPVPGGVGPLTVISLYQNLIDLHQHQLNDRSPMLG